MGKSKAKILVVRRAGLARILQTSDVLKDDKESLMIWGSMRHVKRWIFSSNETVSKRY